MQLAGNVSDCLLIRTQIMTFDSEKLVEIYENNMEDFLLVFGDLIRVDSFLFLDDLYIDTIVNTINRFRSISKSPEIREMSNLLLCYLNNHVLKFNDFQRENICSAYLELQKNAHKINKYRENFGKRFFIELLKDEYFDMRFIREGIVDGVKLYDDDDKFIRYVDIFKEKDTVDFSKIGLGDSSSFISYWYLSSYNLTFAMDYFVDMLKDNNIADVETLRFIKEILYMAERDKKINKKNYVVDDSVIDGNNIGKIKLIANSDFVKPFVSKANDIFNRAGQVQQKIIDYKIENYCNKRTKELIKSLDNDIRRKQ